MSSIGTGEEKSSRWKVSPRGRHYSVLGKQGLLLQADNTGNEPTVPLLFSYQPPVPCIYMSSSRAMNERVPLAVSRWNRATEHVFADPDARSRAIDSVNSLDRAGSA